MRGGRCRKQSVNRREHAGIEAWHKWVRDNKEVIAEKGSPLGKTKRTDKNGSSDTRNEMGAWTVVRADSQEEAARLFLNHPHFMIFPGDRVEVMKCLPIPRIAITLVFAAQRDI